MKDLSEFPEHLLSLTDNDWNKLFEVSEQIKNTRSFGEMSGGEIIEENVHAMPYWEWSTVTSVFVKILNNLQLIISFDWGNWPEGKNILNNPTQLYDDLDTITLCKLLTAIVRSDKFSDGFLIGVLEDGTISKIIDAIKNKRTVIKTE